MIRLTTGGLCGQRGGDEDLLPAQAERHPVQPARHEPAALRGGPVRAEPAGPPHHSGRSRPSGGRKQVSQYNYEIKSKNRVMNSDFYNIYRKLQWSAVTLLTAATSLLVQLRADNEPILGVPPEQDGSLHR